MSAIQGLINQLIKIQSDTFSNDRVQTPYEDETYLKLNMAIMSTLQGAIAEVQYSFLDDVRKEYYVTLLMRYCLEIIQSNEALHHYTEHLSLIADNVRLSSRPVPDTNAAATREEITAGVQNLIVALKDTTLDEFTKRALHIRLNGVRRICKLNELFSTEDVRVQVKLLMADVFAEWDKIVQQDAVFAKKLNKWGTRMLLGCNAFLGLTIDISKVSGLLPPPGD